MIAPVHEQAEQPSVRAEQFYKQLQKLMTEERYEEMAKLGDKMKVKEFLDHVLPEMVITKNCHDSDYLKRCEMIAIPLCMEGWHLSRK